MRLSLRVSGTEVEPTLVPRRQPVTVWPDAGLDTTGAGPPAPSPGRPLFAFLLSSNSVSTPSISDYTVLQLKQQSFENREIKSLTDRVIF